MADKDFKSIDEQLELLRSRGLTIRDDEKQKSSCCTIIISVSVAIPMKIRVHPLPDKYPDVHVLSGDCNPILFKFLF